MHITIKKPENGSKINAMTPNVNFVWTGPKKIFGIKGKKKTKSLRGAPENKKWEKRV